MTTQRFPTSEIKGLTPAVDPTVSDTVFALSGSNYIFDSSGPKSPFGNRLLLPQRRARPEHMQGFRLKLVAGDRVFNIDGDGIWEWNESTGGWLLIYGTPDTTTYPYRWSWGYLAGYVFFAHPRTGILCYNMDTGICVPHSLIGTATPDQVISIVINNGRLITVGPDFYSWSEASNGLSFEPTLGGGGFQQINERVSGDVICVTSYTKGTLTWTTGGVMRSAFAGDSAVYQHRALNTEYRPVNSFCTCRIDDDTVIILDERGLFQSTGEAPTAFSPVFNEFLIEFIKKNNLKVGQNLRIEWDELQRLMYVSYSSSYADAIYESAFVLYPPIDKWGQMNERHFGIFPILIKDSERADDYFGFCGDDSRVRYWRETGSREIKPELCVGTPSDNLVYPTIQRSAQPIDGYPGFTLGSSGHFSTISETGYPRAAYYANGIQTPVLPELTGLNSVVRFGLYRPTGPSTVDECSEITNVLIRSVESGPQDQMGIDYNLIPSGTSDEDYNIVAGSEDYGIDNQNYINSQFRIISTLDGRTEFQSCYPDLVLFTKSARYYSCSTVGVWHIMQVSALDVGESFHISTFEITAASAGRIL